MKRKLIAVSIAAAFVLPFAAQAAGDKAKSADTGASPSASQGASANQGSASQGGSASGAAGAGTFQSLDKNKDGFVSQSEAKGWQHNKQFSTLDKNSDGKLSPEEHAAASDQAGGKAATGATGAGSSEGKSKY
jgi:hypothetical protein